MQDPFGSHMKKLHTSLRIKSVITVKEARKMLGNAATLLNDDQVTEIIDTLELLAQSHITNRGSRI